MSGRVKLHTIDDVLDVWREVTGWRDNEMTREAGVISLFGLLKQDPAYVLNAMYIEFKNVATPSTTVDISGIDKSVGLPYYTALDGSPTIDYLRVPLNGGPRLAVASGYDSDLRSGHYNRGVVHAQTTGTEGVNGVAFAAGSNSLVYGIALVCAPKWSDKTMDVVYSRAYFDTDEQILKSASREIGVAYDVSFNHDE